MSEGIIFVNKGTLDCRASIKWAKQIEPDAKIISVCLENDPYIVLDDVLQLAADENIEHFTIPFKASFIATQNQNPQKAWEFDRLFKALQYQRKMSLFRETEQNYKYVLSSLRGTPYELELIAILNRYITINQFSARMGLFVDSYISHPLAGVQTDEDFTAFLDAEGIVI